MNLQLDCLATDFFHDRAYPHISITTHMRCVGGSDRRRPGGPRPLRRSIGWFPEKERAGFIELLACCQYSSRGRGDPSRRNDYSHRKQETYQPGG